MNLGHKLQIIELFNKARALGVDQNRALSGYLIHREEHKKIYGSAKLLVDDAYYKRMQERHEYAMQKALEMKQ
jgi:hypothetical protein